MVEVYEFVAAHFVSQDGGNEVREVRNHLLQMPQGAPIAAHVTAGAKNLNANTVMLKIFGDGSITWPNGVTETFSGTEFRGVTPGTSITIN